MTRAVRIGVIGCADIARRRMLPAMSASPDVELVAVASRDAARARETADRFGCRAVHGYDALVRSDAIDAVYVPLPAALHAEWVEAALRAGKHVLGEKPLTTEPQSTRRLITLAQERGLALMENVMFVQHSQHEQVRGLLARGAIGELRSFRSAFAIPRLPAGDIRLRADLGGGALWDTGVYPLRAALHFLGEDLHVAGATLTRDQRRSVDVAGTALLYTPHGVSAQLSFGFDHAYRSSYELWGSHGRITVDRAFTPPAEHVPEVRLESRSGVKTVPLPPDAQVARTVAVFADATRKGAVDPAMLPLATLTYAVRERAVVL